MSSFICCFGCPSSDFSSLSRVRSKALRFDPAHTKQPTYNASQVMVVRTLKLDKVILAGSDVRN